MKRILFGLFLLATWALAAVSSGQSVSSGYTHIEDVIYGRKYGTALTLDVFTPNEHPKGRGVVVAISAGWYSDHNSIPGFGFLINALTNRGYTVFAVVHGSSPRFTIPEAVQDMNRAVRFIRFHAKDYSIDPNHIGMSGASAGGHLSLMQGTAGDEGNPKAPDPIDRVSSRLQAVACFFPPTDFLNYGDKGVEAIGLGRLKDYAAPFQFQQWDNDLKHFVTITDPKAIREYAMSVSPIYHANASTPPTLIFHGDADPLVPIQQSKSFIARLQELKVLCQLVVKPGGKHGWSDGMAEHLATLCDWYDKYL